MPSPEAAPEAEAAAVANHRYGHGGHQTDKCGNRQGTTYGYITVQYGDQHNRVTQHNVPIHCGRGRGMRISKLNLIHSLYL